MRKPQARFHSQMNPVTQTAVHTYSAGSAVKSVEETSASQAMASVPYVFPQEWPMGGRITAQRDVTPIHIRSGAPTATGTPKPEIPCRKLGNTQAIIRIWSSSLGMSFFIPI